MSYSLKTVLNVGIILLMVPVVMMLAVDSVSAQERTEQTAEVQEGQDASSSTFAYVAESGDNLTKIVRRTIELYVQNSKTDLSDGKAIAAETWVVESLGAYQLNIGQEVAISESVIESAVTRASGLSESQESLWAEYGPINRNLDTIEPISAPEYVAIDDVKDEESTENSEDDGQQGLVNGDKDDQQTGESSVADSEEESQDDAPWYWWLIGGSALGAMWYVLGGNEAVKNRRKK